MLRQLIVTALWILLLSIDTAPAASTGRTVISFDENWRFLRGDSAEASKPDFDDSAWRKLDVPHDWMIEQPFDERSPGGNEAGALNGGVGWYRKAFELPADFGNHRAILEFDGVYMNSQVWLNGQLVGGHPYGYSTFQVDLTRYLKTSGPNTLAVRTEVVQSCSRFYSGAGIYRHVRLSYLDPVHIDTWGTFVTSEVNNETAKVTVHTTIKNDGEKPASVAVESKIATPNGDLIDPSVSAAATIDPGRTNTFTQTIDVKNPTCWSIESPAMYHLRSTVQVDGKPIDVQSTPFGIRTIEFAIDKGFLLNGQHVPIRGVCDHHDLGCLGSAVNRRALQRQLEILKSFGCNAIRTSHNPPAPELLELCDQMGFIVMDEAFDEWKDGKRPLGYMRFFDQWSEQDIVSLVRRDRNHPSVMMWSIGNEIPEQGSKDGEAMARRLAEFVRREDPTRPVTSALNMPNDAVKTGFSKALDLFGVNYNIGFYNDARVHGHVPMIGSETSSTVSSRGEYGLAIENGSIATTQRSHNQVTSYDKYVPGWANHVEQEFIALRKAPWIAGEFVWTGFDYLGEPTPFPWPSRSSYFGIVDLCGFPKDRFYLYQSQWTDKPMVHILPHWNWAGFEGQPIPVWCYSNADSVELFQNEKSLGEREFKSTDKLHLEWQVPYAAGTLKAVAKKGRQIVATDVVTTAGKPATIELKADRSELTMGLRDLSFITARVLDSDGQLCPNADDRIHFEIDGPATITATDNGNSTDLDSFQTHDRKVFHGLGLAVICAGNQAGTIHLKATADGLKASDLAVEVSAGPVGLPAR